MVNNITCYKSVDVDVEILTSHTILLVICFFRLFVNLLVVFLKKKKIEETLSKLSLVQKKKKNVGDYKNFTKSLIFSVMKIQILLGTGGWW